MKPSPHSAALSGAIETQDRILDALFGSPAVAPKPVVADICPNCAAGHPDPQCPHYEHDGLCNHPNHCPKCGGPNFEPHHYAGDFVWPECDWRQCRDCYYATEPE